jgi:hypothetical protein
VIGRTMRQVVANGFLNLGMVLAMALALAVAVRRAERAEREHPRDPRSMGERWSAARRRAAEVAHSLTHPGAHHRH